MKLVMMMAQKIFRKAKRIIDKKPMVKKMCLGLLLSWSMSGSMLKNGMVMNDSPICQRFFCQSIFRINIVSARYRMLIIIPINRCVLKLLMV